MKPVNIGIALMTIILVTYGLTRIAPSETAISSQSKGDGKSNSNKRQMPKATYSASEPTDQNERAVRKARSSRYDRRDLVPFHETPADTKMKLLSNHWWVNMPALPTAQSDVIVIGEVIDAKAYLSNDKTGVYSEFTVLVEEKLKDGKHLSKGSIVGEREGGAVELPDGRIIESMIGNQNMPRAGARYVMFLKYNDTGGDFEILTAYELREGQVLPLDDAPIFTEYRNVDEAPFLDALRRTITSPN